MTGRIFTKLSRPTPLHVLVVVTVLLSGTAIVFVPWFLSDDFTIFHLISDIPLTEILKAQDLPFYLSYRPVSVLYFAMLYSLFGTTAWMMKCLSAFILLLSILVLRHILHTVAALSGRALSNTAMLAVCCTVIAHPDVLQSLLWIANINELLMTLWYLVSAAAFLKAYTGRGSLTPVFGMLSVIAFIASVLTKQQGLHLPFVLMVVLAVRPVSDRRSSAILWFAVSVMACIALLIMADNLSIIRDADPAFSILTTLWKKPFAMMGILMHAILPIGGLAIYESLLLHPVLAAGTALVLVIGIITLMVRHWHRRRLMLFLGVIGVMMFFPRLAMPVSDRINVLQVFQTLLLVSMFITGRSRRERLILYGIMVTTWTAGILSIADLSRASVHAELADRTLITLRQEHPDREMMLTYYHPLLPTPASQYFHRHGVFGIDTLPLRSGVEVRHILRWTTIPEGLSSDISGDTLTVVSRTQVFHLFPDHKRSDITVLSQEPGVRGASRISVLVPIHPSRNRSQVEYIDGQWRFAE